MADASNELRPYKASVQDVCGHFGVHENTVYNWLKSENPPPHRRVGGVYRFNLAELDEWTAAGGKRPTEPTEERIAS